MSILNEIEAKIGSVHNWPQDILRYLFYIRRPTNSITVKLAAFFYVNKIPREDALELIEEYNYPSLQCVEIFYGKYDVWRTCEGQIHMYQYYNMSIGRMVYINGSDRNQLELVDVDPDDIKIAIGEFFQMLLGKEH